MTSFFNKVGGSMAEPSTALALLFAKVCDRFLCEVFSTDLQSLLGFLTNIEGGTSAIAKTCWHSEYVLL